MNKEEIKNIISNFLKTREEIEFAYLFGSFVNKNSHHDIDVAISLYRDYNYKDLELHKFGYSSYINGELCRLLNTNDVDVVLLNEAPITISQRIVNTGILLFDRDKFSRVEYENNVRKEYIDMESVRKIKIYYLKKRIMSDA